MHSEYILSFPAHLPSQPFVTIKQAQVPAVSPFPPVAVTTSPRIQEALSHIPSPVEHCESRTLPVLVCYGNKALQ